jgi:acyl-CoA thioester hydrolase
MPPDGFSLSTEIVVRFAETDAQGIAHHASYLIWFEAARVAYLREKIGGYQRLRDQGMESPVIEVHARFLRPARFDERLAVYARCVDVRGARFRVEYLVERDGERIAEGWSRHALVDARTMRPIRMPAWLVEAIETGERRHDQGHRSVQ